MATLLLLACAAPGCSSLPPVGAADGSAASDGASPTRDGSVAATDGAPDARGIDARLTDARAGELGPRPDGGASLCDGQFSVGAAGGTFTVCGARVVVPKGAVTAATVIRVARRVPQGAAPFEFAFAGDAFHFTPASLALAAELEVTLPHSHKAPRMSPARRDPASQGWHLFEGCEVGAATARFFVRSLGTFAVLYETVTYPAGAPSGLGSGTIGVTFGGKPYSFDLDAASSYGMFELSADGSKAVRIEARLPSGGGFHNLALVFGIEPTGKGGKPLSVSLNLWSNGQYTTWSYLLPAHGPAGAAADLTASATNQVKGTLSADLRQGAPTSTGSPFRATLDIVVEKYRFPLEGHCGAM
ncbi:MAG: hypothetical protein IT371_25865 [Deltaproteobacteria bacterium]|nr:hypothetical protein [Deltaproteobacteria bacterium]